MKLFADFLPVIIFFVAYKLWGMYVATGVFIAASLLHIAWNRHFHGKVETMQWVTLGLVLVFGGATLLLHDPLFFKWKPTVVNWLFAAAFLGSGLFMERSFLQRMMDQAVSLPKPVWKRLNLAWVTFFISAGAANIYVAYHYTEDTWVNFKLFGMLGLTLAFMIAQGVYLARYIQPAEENH
ncbi:septation protein A [Thiolapillus brandeum]|uniref:Inner membrane-spanning protein YciB n=1 Tax=Thiolapillus brandeum TaxID=1076588 RepID=A0A7U6JHY9_9GAMM|nr:septation protein A [Thiolapillus brandeum]BAO44796.1 intracellular septation protein A [Thiolapillus brandeum]